MDMYIGLLTALVNLTAAIVLLLAARKERKKRK
jgi:hypothetical protein